ncbi:MAG: sulfatase-like hydrolase/transferase [Nitriliruptorales bacterium]
MDSPVTRRDLARRAAVVAALLAPPFVVFVHPALELVRRNSEYFTAGYAAGWHLYLVALVVLAVGVALWFLRRSTPLRAVLGVYLLSGVGWFAYTLVGQVLEPRWLLLALTAVALVAGGIRMRHRVDEAVQTLGLAGAVLVVGLGTSVAFAAPALEAAEASEGEGAGDGAGDGSAVEGRSDLPNVYHVVLDEFQTDMFAAALTGEVERTLDGFLWFPEATTPYGRTHMGMASVFAPHAYAYDEPMPDYVEGAYTDEGSLLDVLRDAGYATTGWIESVRVFGRASPFDETFVHRDVAGDVVGWSEQASIVRSTWLYDWLPQTASSRLIPPHQFDQLEGEVLLPDDVPAVSALSFRAFLNAEGRAPDRGRYVLTHLILPHFPYVLDADCRYVAERTDVMRQTGCATRLIGDLLDRLRALDRYDDSLVVIQSDHGSRYDVQGGELVRMPLDVYAEEFSRARSRSLLLVKPPGSAHDGLRVSDFAATLEDLGPTIADALGLPFDATDGRVSLLADSFPRRPVRHYHFYDAHPEEIIEGDLRRFVITEDGIAFDRSISVPTR